MHSVYLNHAGQTLTWLGMDNKETFDRNLQIKKDEMMSLGWTEDSVEYKFNQHGFRCDDFSDQPSIVFLGCSYTLGVGVAKSQCFSTLVAKKLNLAECNLAQGGGSADTCFRLFLDWHRKIKPTVVVMLQPLIQRIELLSHPLPKFFLPNQFPKEHREFYREWMMSNNAEYNRQKNTFAIAHLCHQINAQFVYLSAEELKTQHFKDVGRDLLHPGPLTHKKWAEILSVIIKPTFQ